FFSSLIPQLKLFSLCCLLRLDYEQYSAKCSQMYRMKQITSRFSHYSPSIKHVKCVTQHTIQIQIGDSTPQTKDMRPVTYYSNKFWPIF
ncbi:hypothetical protein PENTCL1PPCAC_3151, partial [Pristionchus entomophagus]